MAKRGPKPKYDPAIHPNLVRWMCRSGLTNEQIAKELGIRESTLYEWQKAYSEISEALKNSRNLVDHLVEDSLLKRALGYDVYEDYYKTQEDPETGTEQQVLVKRITKHIAGDTTAQIFWLKNRKPAEWRDKQVQELEAGEGAAIKVEFVKPESENNGNN